MKKIKNILVLALAFAIFTGPIAFAMEIQDGKINGETVTSIELHGDHYHLTTESGEEYVLHDDPSEYFPNVEIKGYDEASHEGHDHAEDDHAGHDHAEDDHEGHDHAEDDHAGHDHAEDDHAGHDHAEETSGSTTEEAETVSTGETTGETTNESTNNGLKTALVAVGVIALVAGGYGLGSYLKNKNKK